MDGFVLLDQSNSGSVNRTYRGIYRPGPTYRNELPAISPVNQLWMRETDLMISDYISDIGQSIRIQELYSSERIYLDLVYITTNVHDSFLDEKWPRMGYDIAHSSGYSLLAWDLDFQHPAPEFFHQRQDSQYKPLLILIEKYFRPFLNQYGLFASLGQAQFFLDVSSAMTAGFGSVWEADGYGPFSILKLLMVRSRESLIQGKHT